MSVETSFLFWNVRKKALDQLLAGLVKERSPDVIILAEPPPIEQREALLNALNAANKHKTKLQLHERAAKSGRLHLYSRYGSDVVVPLLSPIRGHAPRRKAAPPRAARSSPPPAPPHPNPRSPRQKPSHNAVEPPAKA